MFEEKNATGHRPRICRRGLISPSTGHRCMARLLVSPPAVDPNCIVVMERRLPMDSFLTSIERVYPSDEWDQFNFAL